jgi:GrpB-like predicted nucleotidyltransferase (UPF0157 family)
VLIHAVYENAAPTPDDGHHMMTDALGLEPGIVRLVEYDARWPALFAAERQRILAHCAGLPLRLEHIGGTSIPGLPAKPVLDIAAGRPPGTAIDDYVVRLEAAGYVHRGERGLPGREFFRRGQPRAYHLHLIEEGGSLWCDYLAFRDYLRTHAEVARQFGDVKRALAEQFAHDREGYINAKTPHVQQVLRLAYDRSRE